MATKTSESPTTDKAAETVQELLEQITSKASEAETRIRQAAREAESDIRARKGDVQDVVKRAGGQIEKYVHDHPAKALGIAFVGGILLSSLLRRR